MSTTDVPTVLVIEDERALAGVYERWLDGRYDVRVAHDGESALEALDAEVDVVVLDRVMPGLSGDEVLERIREGGYGCRVVVVSAVEPDFDVVEMGFDRYLTKPVDGPELVEAIELLRRRSEYTDRVQEYFTLVAKKTLLDAAKTEREREESERYGALLDRIADVEAEVERIQSELSSAEDFEVAFRDIPVRGSTN
jgi:DNA-binding response OmpR family regulator